MLTGELRAGLSEPHRRADFGVVVEDAGVCFDAGVLATLLPYGLRTAGDLLTYAESFPKLMAHALDWTEDEVWQAALFLRASLDLDPSPRSFVVLAEQTMARSMSLVGEARKAA